MKKIILIITMILFFTTGCNTAVYTPTKKVEDFMSKYQNLDNNIITQLDKTVDNDQSLTDEQKQDYKVLMKRQYQNMSYKITDEKIDDDEKTATVIVEIEVYDYISSINKSDNYYNSNKAQFSDKEKYTDYKITEMKKVNDRKKYEIIFNLREENKTWVMENISSSDIEKLHGLSNE